MEDEQSAGTHPQSTDDVKAMIKQGYDHSAQRYLDWALPMPTPREAYVDKTFTFLGPTRLAESTILELGCGAGIPIAVSLASQCQRLVANDISTTQIAMATENMRERGLLHKVELIESDMNSLVFPEHNFDAVVAFYSLIHLPLLDQHTALVQIYHWLKKDGILTCNFGARADPGRTVDGWLGMRSFWSSYGTEKTLGMMREIGFEIVEHEVVFDKTEEVGFLWVVARK